ncbi:MAG: hypothetical protein JSV11_09725 [Nitrospiraceae bacterium]|nr:MAG: hypothetical protein JSV11_09725 [Nitrospiraceae bacterium]
MEPYLQKYDEHKIPLEDLCKRLDSTGQGLSSEDASKRHQTYGFNVLEEKEEQSLIVMFTKHLVNFFALLLWTGAVLAFISEYIAPGEGRLDMGYGTGTNQRTQYT